jgi:AbrB family looped-hinge helix DNA binding protein
MKYGTILTSKGTTTIPIEIRRQLGIKPGMQVTFTKNESGEYVIKRSLTIEEIRTMNKKALVKAGTRDRKYSSGDGLVYASREKFDK